jgi:hypothetical protein
VNPSNKVTKEGVPSTGQRQKKGHSDNEEVTILEEQGGKVLEEFWKPEGFPKLLAVSLGD